jgi:hypothetical protein
MDTSKHQTDAIMVSLALLGGVYVAGFSEKLGWQVVVKTFRAGHHRELSHWEGSRCFDVRRKAALNTFEP